MKMNGKFFTLCTQCGVPTSNRNKKCKKCLELLKKKMSYIGSSIVEYPNDMVELEVIEL